MATITGDQNPDDLNDTLDGTTGTDTIHGLTGNDTINGKGGAGDSLWGDGGNDTVNGGADFDDIHGGEGNDTLNGGGGADQLSGDAGDDVMHGGEGGDFITAFGGIDKVYGDGGDDIVKVGINYNQTDPVEGEVWSGGEGKDTLQLYLGAPGNKKTWTVDLTKVSITGFEKFTVGDNPFPLEKYHYTFEMTSKQFNQFDSILFPTNLGHTFRIVDHGTVVLPEQMDFGAKLFMGDGADKLDGRGMTQGSISILMGGGADHVFGSNTTGNFEIGLEGGNDFFSGRNASELVSGGAGNDDLDGFGGDDILDGGSGDDVLLGGTGDDHLRGRSGTDAMRGEAGDDVFEIDGTSALGDSISGGAGDDHVAVFETAAVTLASFDAHKSSLEIWDGNKKGVVGTAAANVLDFSALKDINNLGIIDGKPGNDTIIGTKIADSIAGGLGSDTLSGGKGADRFIFHSAAESARGAGHRDIITDFSIQQRDRIDLSAIDADTSNNPGNDKFTFIGSDKFHGGGGELRFSGGILQADINGDKIADLEIQVTGLQHLDKIDFIL